MRITGGQLTTAFIPMGEQAGSSGILQLSGNTASFTTTGAIAIGRTGSGSVSLTNGASGTATFVSTSEFGGDSHIVVSGTGSTLTVTGSPGDFLLGRQGAGTTTVSSGGVVSVSHSAAFGEFSGSSGTVTVSGTGSRFDAGADFTVGGSNGVAQFARRHPAPSRGGGARGALSTLKRQESKRPACSARGVDHLGSTA